MFMEWRAVRASRARGAGDLMPAPKVSGDVPIRIMIATVKGALTRSPRISRAGPPERSAASREREGGAAREIRVLAVIYLDPGCCPLATAGERFAR